MRNLVFVFFVLLTGLYLAANAHQWRVAIRTAESCFVSENQAEKEGSAGNRPLFLDYDACYWLAYAQEMAATGAWRVRHTRLDNPPEGRPVHWSQSVSWLLLLAGKLRHGITAEPISLAIENAALWVNPLLFFVLIVGTGWLLFRRLGLIPALVWMVALTALLPLQWSFHPLRPDHHGLHLGLMLSGLLCLILGGLGWTRSVPNERSTPQLFRALDFPGKRGARNYFVASGILGGLGVWTGATVQLFGMGLFAGSALLLVFFMPPRLSDGQQEHNVYEPVLWRWWAMTGAVTSLLFYLIEYAPSFPGMRLEVNHPLYALSWFCVGELLYGISSEKMRYRPPRHLLTALLLVGALLLPALLFSGPVEWHAMRDPLMQRMHKHIDEFRPYLQVTQGHFWTSLFKDFGLLPLVFVLAPFLAGEKRTTMYEWAALWMAFLPALVYAALSLMQVRWTDFFSASCLLLAVIALVILWRHYRQSGKGACWVFLLIAILIGQSLCFFRIQMQQLRPQYADQVLTGELLTPMLQRQFAEKLGALNSNNNFRVLSVPDLSPRLHYYGNVPGITSYYWENLDGLRVAASIFAASDDEEARRLVLERGITHIVLPPSLQVAPFFYHIKNSDLSGPGIHNSLAARLLVRPEALPPWIKREHNLEKELQPGFVLHGKPVSGNLLVFTVEKEPLPDRVLSD